MVVIASSSSPSASVVTDFLGHELDFPGRPLRIVSTVPSQTELLCSLGLMSQIVGITSFCVHPEECFRTKARVGGTKNLTTERVLALAPDLVIANKEENDADTILDIQQSVPVYVSDIKSVQDVYRLISDLGQLCHVSAEAEALNVAIRSSLEYVPTMPIYRVAYLIWKDPYMSVGGDTFIQHMMELSGLQGYLADQTRYPEITLSDLRGAEVDVILLSSEPFPFADKHIAEIEAATGTPCLLVDGELYSWYGPRMLHSAKYFKQVRERIATRLSTD